MPIRISIVIPTYNSVLFLNKAIESAKRAACNIEHELIIIDDCSDDIEQLREFCIKYSSIKLIEKNQKTNAADSRNIGINLADGDYIFLLDSDDEYEIDHIKRRISLHTQNKSGIIFGNFKSRGSAYAQRMLPQYSNTDMRDYLFNFNGDFRSSTISIAKEHFKNTNFDAQQNKHQDWGFAIRAFDNYESITFDEYSSVVIDTAANDSRMSNSLNIKASEYFLDKYITKISHVFNFSKSHLRLAIQTKDKNGIYFLRQNIKKSIAGLPRHKKIIAYSYLALSANIVIPFTSTLLSIARAIKDCGRNN